MWVLIDAGGARDSCLNAFKFAPTYLHLHMGTNVGMGQVMGVNLSYVD